MSDLKKNMHFTKCPRFTAPEYYYAFLAQYYSGDAALFCLTIQTAENNIMYAFICIVGGYLMGSLNPTALIAHLKGIDARQRGTGNLGATNAMLNFGKTAGVAVMIFDIAKAYLVCVLSEALFPTTPFSGLLAGSAAVVGHIYPFYLKFRGGKGFASFGGLVLAFDPELFIFLIGLGMALMLITNISISLQLSTLLLFPVLSAIRTGSLWVALVCTGVSTLILLQHRSNISDAVHGKAPKVRDFIRRNFS